MKNRRLRIAARLSLSAGARADAPPTRTRRSRSSSSSDNRERRPMMPARNGDSHDPRRIDRGHGAACRAFGGRVRVQRSRPGSRAAFYASFGLDVRDEDGGLALYAFGHPQRWGTSGERRDASGCCGSAWASTRGRAAPPNAWISRASRASPRPPARTMAASGSPGSAGHRAHHRARRRTMAASGSPVPTACRQLRAPRPSRRRRGAADPATAQCPPARPAGLHHTSWCVASLDDVGLGMEQMSAAGHGEGWGVGRHVLGSNYFRYVRDPGAATPSIPTTSISSRPARHGPRPTIRPRTRCTSGGLPCPRTSSRTTNRTAERRMSYADRQRGWRDPAPARACGAPASARAPHLAHDAVHGDAVAQRHFARRQVFHAAGQQDAWRRLGRACRARMQDSSSERASATCAGPGASSASRPASSPSWPTSRQPWRRPSTARLQAMRNT